MARTNERQTAPRPERVIEKKGIGAGYQPKPADKPISEGYQPKPAPSDVIVPPPPPKNENNKE